MTKLYHRQAGRFVRNYRRARGYRSRDAVLRGEATYAYAMYLTKEFLRHRMRTPSVLRKVFQVEEVPASEIPEATYEKMREFNDRIAIALEVPVELIQCERTNEIGART